MAVSIWPLSAVPAGLKRTINWNESDVKFDSGAYQAMTPWSRPLWAYEVPFDNMHILKQAALETLVNSVRGKTFPWLFKDPYEYQVGSIVTVRSGYSSGDFLTITDIRSFYILPDSLTIGTMTSALSGTVTLGSQYSYDQDSGIFHINSKATNDVWSVASLEYFRKVRFSSSYQDQGVIWQQFNAVLQFEEIVTAAGSLANIFQQDADIDGGDAGSF